MFSPKYIRLLWDIAAAKAISRVTPEVSRAYATPLETVFKGAQISGTSHLLRVTRIAWTPTWPPTFRSPLRS
jgi:hypothetical protein